MNGNRKSLVPRFTFPGTLDDQWAVLATNPLLNRMKACRSNFSDPHRPHYHYVNPEGVLNDPNGLCYWQDRWHLFYQAYPPEDPRQHWGHAISTDLVHWEDLPYCIYPDPEDRCFSGATYVEENRVIAMYHGTRAGNMIAISSDPLLLNWEKVADKPVIPMRSPDGSEPPYNVFDPCIWKNGDWYYSLSAGQRNDGPGSQHVATDFLFRSKDLEHWEYLHPFLEGDRYTRVGDDGACPYFWPIGSKCILLFFSHTSGGQYLLGDYDQDQQKFHVTYGEKFNFGPAGPGGVHAPSAAPQADGSVIAIFNMNPAKPSDGWNQIMTLPRRLTLNKDGNDVDIAVAGDVESLRQEGVTLKNVTVPANEELTFDNILGNCYELAFEVESQPHSSLIIDVLKSPDAQEYTRITLYRDRGYIDRANYVRDRTTLVTLDNTRGSVLPEFRARAPEIVNVPLEKTEPAKFRVFVDKSVVEVFVNDKRCVALRTYPIKPDSQLISMRSVGNPTHIRSIGFWPMNGIY